MDHATKIQSSSVSDLTGLSNSETIIPGADIGNPGTGDPTQNGVDSESIPDMKKRVWFSPNLDSIDYRALMDFDWNQNRQVHVFKFHSGNLNDSGFGLNNFPEFSVRDGFNRLQSFGLEIAIEVGAIKKDPDNNPNFCNGVVWTQAAQDYVQKVESRLSPGQHVSWLHIDEPLYQTKDGCHVSFDQAVTVTSQYINAIKSNRRYLKIIDIEPYPALSIDELKSWVDSLLLRGVPLDGLTLDIDRNRVDINTEVEKKKFLDLAGFLATRKLRFGLIYWGTKTESDQVYVQDVLNFYVDTSYLRPYIQDVVFQNWHPSANGRLDIPLNLIDPGNPVPSHLGLINSALRFTSQFEFSKLTNCTLEIHAMEYLAFYPDLRNVDPLEHYLNFGGAEKRCRLIAPMPSGFFRVSGEDAIFNSNGTGNYCSFKSPLAFSLAGGLPGESNVRKVSGITAGMKNDGDCIVVGAE